MGYGTREVHQEMLVPFKAAVELGGVRGTMMYVQVEIHGVTDGASKPNTGRTTNLTMFRLR